MRDHGNVLGWGAAFVRHLGGSAPRLAHRGPDGQRTWFSGDGRVGLGHTRLSIIDLATGDQPIASDDEGCARRPVRC